MSSLIRREVIHLDGLGPEVLALLRQLRSAPATSRYTALSVNKSTRIYTVGLAEVLELYRDFFEHFKANEALNGLKANLSQLPADGKTKLFTYVMAEDGDKAQFSYFCLAVRKYESAGEILVDYYLSTYEYSQVKGGPGQGSSESGSTITCSSQVMALIGGGVGGIVTAGLLTSLTSLPGLAIVACTLGGAAGGWSIGFHYGEKTCTNSARPLLDGASDGGVHNKDADSEIDELNLLKALFIAEMINSGAAYLDASNQLHFTGH